MQKKILKVLKNVVVYVFFLGKGIKFHSFNSKFSSHQYFRTKNVEKSAAYSKTFKGNEDGKVNASGPRQIVSQNGMGPGSGYIQR